EMILVIQRVQPEDETQHEPDHGLTTIRASGRSLHARDARPEPVDRDEWRNDQQRPWKEREHRERRSDRIVPEKPPRLVIHLVDPDVRIDAECEEGQAEPYRDDVPFLVRLIADDHDLRHRLPPPTGESGHQRPPIVSTTLPVTFRASRSRASSPPRIQSASTSMCGVRRPAAMSAQSLRRSDAAVSV